MTRSSGFGITVAAGAAVLVLVAPSAAWGSGKTYEVVQCDPLNRNVSGVALQDAPAYAVKQMCDDPKNDHALKISNTKFARYGRMGMVRWSTGSPVLRIVGADVQAWLRRDKGHASRLYVADGEGHEVARVASGANRPAAFRNYSWRSSAVRPLQFVARLRCERHDGCPHSGIAKAWLRNVHLRVADYADPTLQQVEGTIFRTGWTRGDQRFRIAATDLGSGTHYISVVVNGSLLQAQGGVCDVVPGSEFATTFQPCLPRLELIAQASTARQPFHDGRNEITVCAIDYAANQACVDRLIHVDNSPPLLAFTNNQNPNDPELIRAETSDATSGVANGRIYYRRVGSATWRPLNTQLRSGELRARVDSTADPAGRYEFLAVATDSAGNTKFSTAHADGRAMILAFPLKSGVRLSGHMNGGTSRLTVGYGRTAEVSGILTDASGEPLPNQEVTVTEHFGDGALIDRRTRTVRTDASGHWTERLPSGPSRNVTASYVGTRRYLAKAAEVGRLEVKTKATLRLSRRKVAEGHRIAFKGRIGHLAARVPSGGKLVELEVKDAHDWQTVNHPFYTRPNGKYKLHYRFARFYTQNVRYRFRVRVLREHAWPYKAPANSRVRKLLVKAR